jgi:CheY-like chemotaxis protein
MKQFTLTELKHVTSELSVLYVEDEKMIRDGLQASLKQLFKEVEVAEDGAIG